PFGTRCEIKNLNSIKAIQIAISSEVERHIGLLEQGCEVPQETRGFDEDRVETFKLRSKEDAPDYRYMPDPNLPPLILSEVDVGRVQSTMPELPPATLDRLQRTYNLKPKDAQLLMSVGSGTNIGYDGEVSAPGAVQYFEEVAKGRDHRVVFNWVTQELLAQLSRRNDSFDSNPLSAEELGEIIDLIQTSTITGTSAKTLIRYIFNTRPSRVPGQPTTPSVSIKTLVEQLGLQATSPSDAGSLQQYCEDAIKSLPEEAQLVRKGNTKVVMKIVGKVMKLSKGTANAKAATELLRKMLMQGSIQ
ncbi:hypothetical protein FRB99_004713, partial [Tulasnella sp. 403]